MSEKKTTRLTSQKLANAFPRAKLDERRVSQICVKAGVMNKRGEGYEFLPAVDAILTYYKEGYEKRDVAGEGDRARKNRAEADEAEARAMETIGKTCLKKEAKLFWSEERTKVRVIVERAEFLTLQQKTKLLARFADIKTGTIGE